jgi:GDP/UDP-N,N'-diacetylbacillosamine 2-epimerase (hydrolysing)
MNTICVVTSSRADYGILRPLIQRFYDDADINLIIVATGMHLCPEFGYSYREIEDDGFKISRKIDIQVSSDAAMGMSKTMGMALICFSEYFQEYRPDLLVVLGDRYEINAVCCAAFNNRIPIAHLHGGEVTSGAVDEEYRHAITKMSSLHFVSCEAYRKRVIQLGENPQVVFNVGAMGVENVINMPLLSIEDLSKNLQFTLAGRSFGVVTFHPVTLEEHTEIEQIHELMYALDVFPDMNFIITKSNSDAGSRKINQMWDKYGTTRGNCLVLASLGAKRYLSVLKYAALMIGNSSSGILEGPASKISVINIGDRQKGRIMAKNIICCKPEKDEIIRSMKQAMAPSFKKTAEDVINPYGNGDTSAKIIATIKEHLNGNKIKLKKEFYDVEFVIE